MTNKRQNKPRFILMLGVLVLLIGFSYFPSLGNQFVDWDDDVMIYNNQTIASFSLDNARQWFASSHYGMYHPLVQASYAIEYQLFGLNPFVFHLDNLLLHIGNSLLVFIFLLLLAGSWPLAFTAALLWGVHPVHVESVAWATERKDVLFAFFYLAALICYLRYLQGRGGGLFKVLLAFLLALLAKPMALSLPFVLLLIDFYRGRKPVVKLLKEKTLFFLLALIFGLVSLWAKQSTGGLVVPEPPFSYANIFVASYRVIFYYLPRTILPFGFNQLYPLGSYVVESLVPLPPVFLAAPALFLLFFGLFFYFGRKQREVVFGLLFFLLTIAPVILLMVPGIFADRYAYLPSLGIYFIVGWGGVLLFEQYKERRTPLIIGGVILVVFLGGLTWQRCQVWRDTISLYDEVCLWYPTVPAAFQHRAQTNIDRREFGKALDDLNHAIKLNPKFTAAYNSRGNLYFYTGKTDLALADFMAAVRIAPRDATSHNNLGYLLTQMEQYPGALRHLNEALRLDPRSAEAFHNRGNYWLAIRDYRPAINDYTAALKLKPTLALTYFNRSVARYNLGEYRLAYEDALAAQRLGFRLNPNDLRLLLEKT
ncbi:MAG: tetratricopeptide repeat protein [Candidatus Margulisbacteria bacterium]|nr:tetratricopeptide repeat protein [Candidatus Margulisiibacteriota bacterium]MBU1617764.1 tetratricopeptide repeat protein [Candidatus Margulisiibacteriota bacterium]MBU1867795.1 tetratricopeptide repeat protein [Candidatus Margulisiibacteriota bacterium]